MILGIDIGGNNIKAVCLDDDGTVLKKLTRPTGRGQPADLKDRLLRIASDLSEESKPEAIGLGVCGLVDTETGRILASSALPRLRNCVICEKLATSMDTPVSVFKDSVMATYGEWKVGAAQGKRDVVLFNVGANVSGGVISGGNLLMGHSGNLGGFGHISVDPGGPLCVCGNRGCLGLLGSSQGLARHYRDITHQDKAPEEVTSMIEKGDANAIQALDQTCRCLAIAIGATINVMDPELILLSGGLGTLGETILNPLRREIMGCVFPEKIVDISIECGDLGNYAGAIGSALYVQNRLKGTL